MPGGALRALFDFGGLGGKSGSVIFLSSFGGNLGGFEPPNPTDGGIYYIILCHNDWIGESTLLGSGGGS